MRITIDRLVPMLPVRDLARAVAFYERLGFAVQERVDAWGWAMLRHGACNLMLDRSIHPAGDAPRTGVLYLYPGDIVAYHAQVRGAGVDVPDLDETFYGMVEFRLDDPDGNRLWIGAPPGEAGEAGAADDADADATVGRDAGTGDALPAAAADVLDFWFRESTPSDWFRGDAAFDAAIRARFAGTLAQALRGELSAWRATPRGRLAEVVVLDQFTRNLGRGTAAAFAGDAAALVLAQEAVRGGALAALDAHGRTFLLMPYMHSESAAVHVEAARLFAAHTPAGNHDYELRHKAIVDRFGRYPHRNAALGRESTAAELAFLQEPGSSF